MVKIKLTSTFEKAKDYIRAVEENNEDIQQAWEKYMIEPFWADITHGVNRDVSFMKPEPVQDINALKEQIKIFSQLSIDKLHSEFNKITAMLPKGHDEPVFVALYPACDSDKILRDRENGVRGCCPDGNVIIRINSLVQNYYDWILYVFAHEYHHGVWGYNAWINDMNLNGAFYEPMIIEGQADFFAESLFPKLIPQWNRPFDSETEAALWERLKTNPAIHEVCMFGDEGKGLPWYMGYVFGRSIVSDYMQKHPNMSFLDLLSTRPENILSGSRFKF